MDTQVATKVDLNALLTDWVRGFDTSHWEPIDWDMLISQTDLEFSIFKAAEGTVPDSTFAFNKASCQAKQYPWGAYYYYHPGDPIAQARFFVETVGDGCKVYVCDVETTLALAAVEAMKVKNARLTIGPLSIGKPTYPTFRLSSESASDTARDASAHGVTPSEIRQYRTELALVYLQMMGAAALTLAQQVSAFLHEVKRLVPDAHLLVYSSPYFCNTYLKPTSDFVEFDLWIAHVTSATQPIIPAPWSYWTFWQYTFSLIVPGAGGALDGDRWYDTREAMVAYFGNSNPVPPPVYQYNHLRALTLVNNQNVRSGPGIGYSVVGKLQAGMIVKIGNVLGPYEYWAKIYDDNHVFIGWAAIKYAGKTYMNIKE